MEVSLRSELGAHLRAARAAVAPEQVGLDGGGRRRTPGLRREEVAALAGVSLAWYTWLEQGRVQPSRQVVDAICTALRMTPDAHQHALSLAGFLPSVPLAENGRATISAETHELVHRFRDIPTLILDERFDIRAENAVHHRLWGDLTAIAPDRRNLLIWLASDLPPRRRVLDSQPLLRGLYEHFRTATGHAPGDPRAEEIVRMLHEHRPEVAHWWRCRAVATFRPTTVEVSAAETSEGVLRLTFSLLRPVADQGVLLLLESPADPATAKFLERSWEAGAGET